LGLSRFQRAESLASYGWIAAASASSSLAYRPMGSACQE
jgi:hypothetical protein